MKYKISNRLFALCLIFMASLSYGDICPNPRTSALQWGEVPPPWLNNPFSDNVPQGDKDTSFVRANIMVTGAIGRGVVCAYQNSLGFYSIWWPIGVKKPSEINIHWRVVLGGYECTDSLDACVFFPGKPLNEVP